MIYRCNADLMFTCESRKGQALQFNWLYEKGAFLLHSDGTFSVDFGKVTSENILTIDALLCELNSFIETCKYVLFKG